jgi:hypothetical protein
LDAPFPDFCGNIAGQEELLVVVWRKELEMSDFRGGTMIKVPHSGESPVDVCKGPQPYISMR